MKVLVVDDTLGNPKIVRHLLQDLKQVISVDVVDSLKEAVMMAGIDVIILGGRCLSWARELRGIYPEVYIIGRIPWFTEGPYDFFPWGDELRDPTLPLSALIQERLNHQENLPDS
jgi:hypothetical protein